MKILYAAGNNSNAAIQLFRFIQAIECLSVQLKIAAFKKSSPSNLNIDWTLDCLLNVFNPSFFTLESDNLSIYFEQIKYFTSYIGDLLNIPVWQCSSSLINYGLHRQQKYNLGVFKYYAHSLYADERLTERLYNILDRSDINFVYSHFGDLLEPPILLEKFQWIRPYHQVGKVSIPCRHHLVAGIFNHDIEILKILSKHPDSVAFIPYGNEDYQNILTKDLQHEEEYYCNIQNSSFFLSRGQTSFLADAFYNNKYSLIIPEPKEAETLLNSCISNSFNLSSNITSTENINIHLSKTVQPFYNDVKYLHQIIMEII